MRFIRRMHCCSTHEGRGGARQAGDPCRRTSLIPARSASPASSAPASASAPAAVRALRGACALRSAARRGLLDLPRDAGHAAVGYLRPGASAPLIGVALARDLVVVAVERACDPLGHVLVDELNDRRPFRAIHAPILDGRLGRAAQRLQGLPLQRLPVHARAEVLNVDPPLRHCGAPRSWPPCPLNTAARAKMAAA
eukprot:CAMPEP_0179317492 /NCGR_PEP_ID=MMETSP0797-20121207/56293_1 /TAXON_ID=47934 /ORGANISM="Dinophysis acuminata, Strain DAEP01" /LENGTH=195 /DNA_ID=CAMNT_0021028425 /DNA_START=81 /DNA_END=668 /DNA_ORIENTATION=-